MADLIFEVANWLLEKKVAMAKIDIGANKGAIANW